MNDKIVLPFPDSRLSPNSRSDRRRLTSLRQTARNTGFFETKMSGIQVPAGVPLHLYLIFNPPNKTRRDIDNLLSASKSMLDGIFSALGVDDSNVKKTTLEMGEVVKDGRTTVMITVVCPDMEA